MSLLNNLPIFKSTIELERDVVEKIIVQAIIDAANNHDEEESKLVTTEVVFDLNRYKIITDLMPILVSKNIAANLLHCANSLVLRLEFNNELANCNSETMLNTWMDIKLSMGK